MKGWTYAVFVKKALNDEPLYRNYNRDVYTAGEIVALFVDAEDAADFAKTWRGYYDNALPEVGLVHPLMTVGHNFNIPWEKQLPKEIVEAWNLAFPPAGYTDD